MSADFAAPPVVLALALLPALLWGFAPILSKRALSIGGTPLQATVLVLATDSALYWIALAIRGGSQFADVPFRTLALFCLVGIAVSAGGFLAIFTGVERLGASVNSATLSAQPLFSAAFAVGLLDERLTLTAFAGVVVLAVGLSRLAFARGGDVSGWSPWDLRFPLLGAVLVAGGNVVRRYALRVAPITPLEAVTLNESAAIVALVAYVLLTGRLDDVNAPRRAHLLFAARGALTAVALLSMFAALAHPGGRVVVVDPLVATAPLFTVAFASVALEDVETVTRGIVGGAILVVAGAVLVSVG